MNIVIFEDPKYANFEPLALSRPAFMLLSGSSKIYLKWLKLLSHKNHFFICRPYLADLVAAETGVKTNIIPEGKNLFINGRFLPGSDSLNLLKKLKSEEAAVTDGELLAFRLDSNSKLFNKSNLLGLYQDQSYHKIRNNLKEIKAKATGFNHLWDLVNKNGEIIEREFSAIKSHTKTRGKIDPKANLIRKNSIVILSDSRLSPQVTIDASSGPVIIDSGTVIEPLTYIKGPTYIGPDCRLVGGVIREGCSFGPVCRIGGEVEETIMLGYDNKHHDGFLGHSYLGEWVNLGAMTTNSDLKNNYGEIAVMVNDRAVETGNIKIGGFIGDHTKTGIGTLLNTGISVGFSCNLYGGGLFQEKMIGSFSWGTPGSLIVYRIEKAVQTAISSMSRRNIKFSSAHKALFEHIFRLSQPGV